MSESKRRYRMLIVLGMILLALLLVFLFYRTYAVARENILNSTSMEIGQRTKDLEFILQESVTELSLTADMLENMIKNEKSNADILDYLTYETETMSAVFKTNNTGLYGYIRGEYIDGVGWTPDKGYDPKSRPWYIKAAQSPGEVVLVDPYLDAQTNTVLMSVSKMLEDRESVVSFDIHLTRMQRQVEKIALDTGWYALVFSDDRFIVASSHQGEIGGTLTETDSPFLSSMFTAYEKAEYQDFEFTFDGHSYIAFDKPMYGTWHALVIRDASSIFSSQSYLYIAAAVVLLLISVYVGIVIAYTNRRRTMAEEISIQLQSIADIYLSVYKLDLLHETYEEKRGDLYIQKLVRHASGNPVDMVREVMGQLAKDAAHPIAPEISNLTLQAENLRDTDVATYEFETLIGWIRSRYIVTERKGSEVRSMLWLMENITEEKQREEKLRREAIHDELTGLFNRRAYENKLHRYSDGVPELLVCIVIDVNGVKIVNDSLGHAAGDELLRGAAACIKRCFGSAGNLYRTGGDEFVALIEADETAFSHMIKAFDAAVSGWSGETAEALSISYGYVASKEFPAMSVTEIAKIADDRMYESKRKYYSSKGIDRRRGN